MNKRNIKELMALVLHMPETRLADTQILTELVNDSFVLIDMIIEIQDEFDIILTQDDLKSVKTVGHLCSVVQKRAEEMQTKTA